MSATPPALTPAKSPNRSAKNGMRRWRGTWASRASLTLRRHQEEEEEEAEEEAERHLLRPRPPLGCKESDERHPYPRGLGPEGLSLIQFLAAPIPCGSAGIRAQRGLGPEGCRSSHSWPQGCCWGETCTAATRRASLDRWWITAMLIADVCLFVCVSVCGRCLRLATH
jgi:hypothetical protein